jgi:hypothetical protein
MTQIVLEEVEAQLVGRIYVSGRKTSAYLIPCQENFHLFSKEQIELINNQIF